MKLKKIGIGILFLVLAWNVFALGSITQLKIVEQNILESNGVRLGFVESESQILIENFGTSTAKKITIDLFKDGEKKQEFEIAQINPNEKRFFAELHRYFRESESIELIAESEEGAKTTAIISYPNRSLLLDEMIFIASIVLLMAGLILHKFTKYKNFGKIFIAIGILLLLMRLISFFTFI